MLFLITGAVDRAMILVFGWTANYNLNNPSWFSLAPTFQLIKNIS